MKIKLSDNKQLSDLIRRVAPNYRKHDVHVNVRTSIVLGNTYWDGGSRYDYHAVNLLTNQVSMMERQAPTAYGGKFDNARVDIPNDVAIIQTGVFCGKQTTAHVYVNQSNYLSHQS